MKLLHDLCSVHAPSGNEGKMTEFLLNYIAENSSKWSVQPTVIAGDGFQDCIILEFGKPRTMIFTHIDSIGFTVRYDNVLVPIGGPEIETGYRLTGNDSGGDINCKLVLLDDEILCDSQRVLDRGTELVFECNFRETENSVQSCYLDNRLGVYASLKIAETLKDGIIVFSCYEEHGGGTVPFLLKYLYEKHAIHQALVCDITWATNGVTPGNGVAISLRDSRIPRKSFLNKIVHLAKESKIPFQLEVEGSGGSDGKEIQHSIYPIDWCFIGAAEENVHSPDEKVHKNDIDSMIKMYDYLMLKL